MRERLSERREEEKGGNGRAAAAAAQCNPQMVERTNEAVRILPRISTKRGEGGDGPRTDARTGGKSATPPPLPPPLQSVAAAAAAVIIRSKVSFWRLEDW